MGIASDNSALRQSNVSQWFILIGLVLGVTVTNGFARFTYGLIVARYAGGNELELYGIGWLGTINALGYIVGAVFTMLLLQKFPPKNLFAFGLMTTSVTLFLTGLLVKKIEFQFVLRFLAGLFGAISFSTAGALGVNVVSKRSKNECTFHSYSVWNRRGLGNSNFWGNYSTACRFLRKFVLANVLGNHRHFVSNVLSRWVMVCVSRLPRRSLVGKEKQKIPIRSMCAIFAGYASFGLGYIVYLTFISADGITTAICDFNYISLGYPRFMHLHFTIFVETNLCEI